MQRPGDSAATIHIKATAPERWLVTVRSASTTEHEVTLGSRELARLGGDNHTAEEILEESFRFLLEREPNTAILSRFDLKVIGDYFPDYEAQLVRRLAQSRHER